MYGPNSDKETYDGSEYEIHYTDSGVEVTRDGQSIPVRDLPDKVFNKYSDEMIRHVYEDVLKWGQLSDNYSSDDDFSDKD